MQKPPSFPPSSSFQGSIPRNAASGGPASIPQPVAPNNLGQTLVDRPEGVCTPALLGYFTAAAIALFGAVGTLFSDLPGDIKKGLFAGYGAGAVSLVLLSSFDDSHHRISRKDPM